MLHKKLLVALLAFILSNLNVSAQSKDHYKVACIGFYNCENFYDTINQPNVQDEEFLPESPKHYNATLYLDKVHHLAEVLSQIGTDTIADGLSMFGCAEIENELVLKDLINDPQLVYRNYKIVHYDSPDLRGIDVALIYNPKYFKVLHSEPLFVHLPDEADSTGAMKQHYTRDVLYVYGEYDGEPMHVFVNHWPSRRGGEETSAPFRALAAEVCKAKVDSIIKKNPDAKIIVMGDLNDDPTSASVTQILKVVDDPAKVKRGELYDPWTAILNSGTGTLMYNNKWNLFDQLIVSSSFISKKPNGYFFKSARIFKKDFMIEQTGKYAGSPKRTFGGNKYLSGYSDHLPTYLILLKQVK